MKTSAFIQIEDTKSMEAYDETAHIESLKKISSIVCVSNRHWRVKLSAPAVRYDLNIHLLRGFPEVCPVLRIMPGLHHSRADLQTGEVLFPHLQDDWNKDNVLLGSIVEKIIHELTANPPTLTKKLSDALEEFRSELNAKDEIIKELKLTVGKVNKQIYDHKKKSLQDLQELQEIQQELSYSEKARKQVEKMLKDVLDRHDNCGEKEKDGKSSGNDELQREIQRMQGMLQQINDDFKQQMENANKKMNSVSEFISQMKDERKMFSDSINKLLQQPSPDINVRSSQEITDSTDKEIFNYVVTKVSMYFFDCKIVNTEYVDAKVVLDSPIFNVALDTMQLAKDLLNNFPIIGIILSISDSIISKCGDWYLRKLFENVLKFEIKIGSENTMPFAKVFGLALLADKKFQDEKCSAMKKKNEDLVSSALTTISPREASQKLYLDVADTYCDRLFAVLTTGAMSSLWDEKTKSVSSQPIRILEALVREIFPTLAIGESVGVFKKNVEILGEKSLKNGETPRKISRGDVTLSSKLPTVVKRGNMRKQGPSPWSLWKTRHFVLFSDGKLYYEEILQTDTPRDIDKVIRLRDSEEIRQFADRPGFDIVTRGREWKIQCSSTEEVRSWIEAITKVKSSLG